MPRIALTVKSGHKFLAIKVTKSTFTVTLFNAHLYSVQFITFITVVLMLN